jgi:hypothetical protein
MFCQGCTKLSYQYTNKVCMRCQSSVTNTICVICDTCSATAKQCSACLKKIQNSVTTKHKFGGCGSCKR